MRAGTIERCKEAQLLIDAGMKTREAYKKAGVSSASIYQYQLEMKAARIPGYERIEVTAPQSSSMQLSGSGREIAEFLLTLQASRG